VSIALIIHRAMSIRRIILLPVARLAIPYFSTLFHKRHDFRKSFVERKMCGSILSAIFICSIPHSKHSCRILSQCSQVFV